MTTQRDDLRGLVERMDTHLARLDAFIGGNDEADTPKAVIERGVLKFWRDELSALSAPGEPVACESDRAGRCLACGGTGGHDEGCRGCRCPVCLPYAAPPESKWIPEAALHALRNYEQADEPGVMVLVSREALDLAIAALTPKVKP